MYNSLLSCCLLAKVLADFLSVFYLLTLVLKRATRSYTNTLYAILKTYVHKKSIEEMKRIFKMFLPYGLIILGKGYQDYKKFKNKEGKEYDFDVILSIGPACRPARYLENHNLRFCANPLDWMMSYSLDTVIYLYQTKFKDFFLYSSADKIKPNWFIDTKNSITSIHYAEIGLDPQTFNKKMKNRFKAVQKKLKKANKICFISNRNENTKVFSDFLNEMSKIYSGKITLINIKSNNEIDGNLSLIKHDKIDISERLELIEYEFNDVHKNGTDKTINPDFWLGNEDLWNSIVKKISLNINFISYLLGSRVK